MDEKTIQLVNQIKEYLKKMYGEKIKQIILYGSHVRGEALEDSDVDILVLVDESLNPFEVRKSLSGILLEILLEKEEFISVIALPRHFFESYNSPFLLNVKKEGVIL